MIIVDCTIQKIVGIQTIHKEQSIKFVGRMRSIERNANSKENKMAIADDRFFQSGQSRSTPVYSPKSKASEHSVVPENVRANGHARRSSSGEHSGPPGGPLGKCPGSQQAEKAGTVNGKTQRRFQQSAHNRESPHMRSNLGRRNELVRSDNSIWFDIKSRAENIVDIAIWGGVGFSTVTLLIHLFG